MSMRLLFARLLLLAAAAAGTTWTTAAAYEDPLPPVRASVAPAAAPNARGGCDEGQLKRDAAAALAAHFDVELGAVAAGDPAHVGFQHLKPADALFAAQALAHDDFTVAAAQFQRVLKFQRLDGLLPHLVYGPSVPPRREWIPSNRTFHPGPAFWKLPPESLTADAASDGGAEASAASNGSDAAAAAAPTSTLLAPPIAADVAWQIFRLAPYDAVLGVVSYQTPALQFLCNVYEPLKRLQQFILTTRAEQVDGSTEAPSGRLAAHHPWETFSSLSPHWMFLLSDVKKAADYHRVVRSIPEEAKERFAAGAVGAGWTQEEAITDMYEPMIYLASTLRAANGSSSGSSSRFGDEGPTASFAVADVEFNSLVLRSAQGLVNIAHILTDHSSVCTDFSLSRDEMVNELGSLRSTVRQLQTAIVGNATQTTGFWNATSKFFDDVDFALPTSVHSMRGVLPAYASELPPVTKMSVVEHFFSPAGSFDFFCAKFPATFFACSSDKSAHRSTWTLYNYFAQRAFTLNGFPGVAEFVRNKTRDMVCTASSLSPAPVSSTMAAGRLLSTRDDISSPSSAPPTGARAVLSLVYDSDSGKATPELFDDDYIGSTLAAAVFLNILLPAVTAPPSPDKPPVDHRMLTVIMCVELVVAFGVALSCVLFSVYFVANRPRDGRVSPPSPWENGPRSKSHRRRSRGRSGQRRDRDDSEVGDDAGSASSSWAQGYPASPYSDERVSYSSVSGHNIDQGEDDLEEALLSDDDEHAYGSIEPQPASQTTTSSLWSTVKGGLHAISPW